MHNCFSNIKTIKKPYFLFDNIINSVNLAKAVRYFSGGSVMGFTSGARPAAFVYHCSTASMSKLTQ